jgi:5'-nucleotidase (lipoprotein e(P4) family)
LQGCATAPHVRPDEPHFVVVDDPKPTTVPPGMQYLYGSGEAAAQSMQMWRGLVAYVASQVATPPADSVVLAPDATLAAPKWIPCGTKPKAVVFDVDETVLLNLGFEANDAEHPAAYSEKLWQAWERTGTTAVAPTAGAPHALAALRAIGVTVIFNTNRSLGTAAASRAAIEGAGLGPAVHGETLYLAGDDAMGSKKDGRRAMIAAKYCVLAMGGDQLGDFSDLFNAGLTPAARRAAVLSAPLIAKFGAGWFVQPNPVYGTALKGGIDDVFPADKRWSPPASGEK